MSKTNKLLEKLDKITQKVGGNTSKFSELLRYADQYKRCKVCGISPDFLSKEVSCQRSLFKAHLLAHIAAGHSEKRDGLPAQIQGELSLQPKPVDEEKDGM